MVSWRWSVPGNANGTYNYNYTYDDNGNIVSETVNGKTTTYEYDSANQLIRENNQAAGMTWEWVYDGAGNILSKTEYNHTTGARKTVNYTYGDPNNPNWGDLLTGYNGITIAYDTDDADDTDDTNNTLVTIGNPTYDGTWHYTWEYGRQLKEMWKTGTTWTFTYDVNGMRTGRTNGTVTYSYLYNGSQLTQMTRGSVVMRFSYGTDGRPLVISYNDVPYYYITNLQGDVVAIVDSSGATVVSYVYDAWGRLISTDDDTDINLGEINPLRYRGYVYDQETSLYYLQSRYYNPEWGRFINADSLLMVGQGAGANLFVYCLNNPISYADDTGNFPWLVVALAACAVVGFIYGATTDRNLSEALIAPSEENTIPSPTFAPAPQTGKHDFTKPSSNIDDSAPLYDTSTTLEKADNGLTPGERATNIIIGTTFGLMVGGAVIFVGGAVACVAGYSSVLAPVLGVTGQQAVAWGMLAYDVFPIFVAPFLGMEIEPLEYPS